MGQSAGNSIAYENLHHPSHHSRWPDPGRLQQHHAFIRVRSFRGLLHRGHLDHRRDVLGHRLRHAVDLRCGWDVRPCQHDDRHEFDDRVEHLSLIHDGPVRHVHHRRKPGRSLWHLEHRSLECELHGGSNLFDSLIEFVGVLTGHQCFDRYQHHHGDDRFSQWRALRRSERDDRQLHFLHQSEYIDLPVRSRLADLPGFELRTQLDLDELRAEPVVHLHVARQHEFHHRRSDEQLH